MLPLLALYHILVTYVFMLQGNVFLFLKKKYFIGKHFFVYCFLFSLAYFIISFLLQPKIPGILLYLKLHTNEKGKYDYTYLPKENQTGYSYHLIRHLAMNYVLASHVIDKPILSNLFKQDIQNSLSYALASQVSCNPPQSTGKNTSLCLGIYPDQPMIATNAFGIVALHAASQLKNISQEDKAYYISHMIALEKYVSLSFKDGHLMYPKNTDTTSIRYQNGQALLAWSSLYEVTHDETYKEKAKLLKQTILQKLQQDNDIMLHHWFLIGLREYYQATKETMPKEEKEYLQHAAQHMISLQIRDKKNPLYGTFRQEDTEEPTDSNEQTKDPLDASAFAVRIEALGVILTLLSLDNDTCSPSDVCAQLRSAIHIATPAFNKSQINIVDILGGLNVKSFGGFPARQKDFLIQIDYLQHALSAYEAINRYR